MKFKDYFRPSLYIDLGTANTLVMEKNRGLVANEPSVIAYTQTAIGGRRVIAVGNDAKSKLGRTPGQLTASRPLRDGVVAELDATEAMLKYFLARGLGRRAFLRPNLVISLPYGVSDVEKKAVRDCGIAAGASEVSLIEEPMAAAIGAGLPVGLARGSMIIDIGGGTTEAAVISLHGIVVCEAVRVGGHAFDEAIVETIRRKHNLVVGDQSAERIKIQIGSAVPGDLETKSHIRGVDFTTGLPKEITVSAHEVWQALEPLIQDIIFAAQKALQKTPPELLGDLLKNGAVVAGGGALLKGMAERLQVELGLECRISDEPLLTIARGGQAAIQDRHLLERITLD